MPHRTEVQPNFNLVAVHCWGDITQTEIETALTEMPQMEGFRAGLNLLVDFRGCTTPIGWWQIRHLADYARHGEQAWGRSKWAIVVSSDLVYGLVRVFVALANTGNVSSQVFRDLDKALAWLETEADAAVALERLAATLAADEAPPPASKRAGGGLSPK